MELNILYATDENYAMYTGMSLYLLLANNTSIDDIKIHILDNALTDGSKEKLDAIARSFGHKIK